MFLTLSLGFKFLNVNFTNNVEGLWVFEKKRFSYFQCIESKWEKYKSIVLELHKTFLNKFLLFYFSLTISEISSNIFYVLKFCILTYRETFSLIYILNLDIKFWKSFQHQNIFSNILFPQYVLHLVSKRFSYHYLIVD